ncbi:DNA alkylation repair protein [Liquorilactobacillus mali]|uniref:DNA alkylation repair protein n=1 Tax=Liquorilactobacillus mali KCTC 3596 = DSM 20444 TaxID=1046596 RepID=A0A0R2E430_9LACO|nr:DNA alkylation repair protein [Liquorilactobacillus mali]KRN11086.1 DNA alkylation repair protein [Liquorilactobacillus mali KCTC 3596 = DSM 20444]QFQ75580.1 DNA alkylation repair protein [Liquorilactobacillus mali]
MQKITEFKLVGEAELKGPMAAYMKNKFFFVGVKTPERKRQSKELLKVSKKMPLKELIQVIDELYQRSEREYQYVAIDISFANVKRFSFTEMKFLTQYVTQKAWWDSVDAWRKVFGKYVQLYPDEKRRLFELFYKQDNFWMRRISILLQLLEKETMDKELLTLAILYDQHTDEFFIQKAIGWALRNYSKFDSAWVKNFIEEYPLHKLATREASIYLN